jgi:radical SAM/CxCxxxxC motif protein YfkAB
MSEPLFDPWEPELNRRLGSHRLTSIEVTVTNRCNMRCVHCAVGETLSAAMPDLLPLDLLLRRLDELPDLSTLSVTGGEPAENRRQLETYVAPLLRYARERGVWTQVNTNLTFDLDRYRMIAPYTSVLHITWNYPDLSHFHRIAWGGAGERVALSASARLYERILANASALSAEGHFLSAETMLNRETAPYLGYLNRMVSSTGCRRHEVNPMYRVDWAAELPVLSLPDYREAVSRLLAERDPALWLLLGTFPMLPCSPAPEDRDLLRQVKAAPKVTVRNCPDGRNRLNVNLLTGEVLVTDFTDLPPLGNIRAESLALLHDRWQGDPAFAPFNCYCPGASCTGPNLLVARMYFPEVDFRHRQAIL